MKIKAEVVKDLFKDEHRLRFAILDFYEKPIVQEDLTEAELCDLLEILHDGLAGIHDKDCPGYVPPPPVDFAPSD